MNYGISILNTCRKFYFIYVPALYGRNYEFALTVQLLHQLSTSRRPTAAAPPHHCMLYFVRYQMCWRVRLSYPYLWKTSLLCDQKLHIDGGLENPMQVAQVVPIKEVSNISIK